MNFMKWGLLILLLPIISVAKPKVEDGYFAVRTKHLDSFRAAYQSVNVRELKRDSGYSLVRLNNQQIMQITTHIHEIEHNCDGLIDEPTAVDVNLWYADNDGDGYGDPSTMSISCDPPSTVGYVNEAGDCDDLSLSVNPDALEVCEDGIDNDCDGSDLSCQIAIDLANADTKLYGNFDCLVF